MTSIQRIKKPAVILTGLLLTAPLMPGIADFPAATLPSMETQASVRSAPAGSNGNEAERPVTESLD